MAEMSAERLLMSAADSMGNRSIGPVAKELRALAERAGVTQDQAAAGLADGSIKSTNKTMLNAIRGAITSAVNYTADALTIPEQYIPPELRGKGKQAADLAGMFSPGADVMDAAQSSGDMMDAARRGDLMGMAGAGAGLAAAGLGMFVPGTAKGYASAAEGMARGGGAAADAAGDYRGLHRAPLRDESNAALHEVNKIFGGDDIYGADAARMFGHGNARLDRGSIEVMRAARGNPDAMVTVYRAVPKGVKDINAGDWVTPNKAYASQHGGDWVEDGAYDVIEKQVPARDLFTDGNSIHEFGYSPSSNALSPSAPPMPPAQKAAGGQSLLDYLAQQKMTAEY
jgi:hypothetical protein